MGSRVKPRNPVKVWLPYALVTIRCPLCGCETPVSLQRIANRMPIVCTHCLRRWIMGWSDARD